MSRDREDRHARWSHARSHSARNIRARKKSKKSMFSKQIEKIVFIFSLFHFSKTPKTVFTFSLFTFSFFQNPQNLFSLFHFFFLLLRKKQYVRKTRIRKMLQTLLLLWLFVTNNIVNVRFVYYRHGNILMNFAAILQ